jgi:hypothetical protein
MLDNGWLTLIIIVAVIGAIIIIYHGCLWWALRANDIQQTQLREPLTRTMSITTDITSVSIEP